MYNLSKDKSETTGAYKAYSGMMVLPSQPRLAESALVAGVRVAVVIAPVPQEAPPVQEEPYKIGFEIVEKAQPVRKQLGFLISGRFDKSKAEIAKIIENDGHAVLSTYQDAVDVVIVPSLNSRTDSSNKARGDGKKLVTLDGLEEYLETYKSN